MKRTLAGAGMWLLALSVFGQSLVIASDYIVPWSERLWAIREKSAWERAGILSTWYGEEATAFTGFLRSEIPEDAAVIIPTDARGKLRFPNLMQYFLFPRTIQGCLTAELADCLFALRPQQTFIIQVYSYPAPDQIPGEYSLISFSEDFALYAPVGGR